MRIAALYDIHGNLPALEAVLADVRAAGVDRIVVGGDVLPGPMPHEALSLLRGLDLPVDFIRGNGDRETLAWSRGQESSAVPASYRDAMRWNAQQLQPADADAIARWPTTLRLTIPSIGNVLFCHATPQNDTDIFTRRTPEEWLLGTFRAIDADVVICGHTHMPFDRQIGGTRVVNAGSVGMPFGEPGAAWLLVGQGIEPRHTAYDLSRGAERIRGTPYPQAEEFASTSVLRPPPADVMEAVFERAAERTFGHAQEPPAPQRS